MGTQSRFPVSIPRLTELPLSIGSRSVRPPLFLLGGSHSPRGTSSTKSIPTSRIPRKKQNLNNVRAQGGSYRRATTGAGITMLPDYVLLEVFDFYQMHLKMHYFLGIEWKWQSLVHVCRRWRQIIYASPHRLDLRILCTHRTLVRKNLHIWPAFPIVIDYLYSGKSIRPKGEGNVIAALKHPDRVSDIRLEMRGWQLGKMAKVMKKPFPVLRNLTIGIGYDGNAPVLPSGFLGGSAPLLESIYLVGIPFPTLPKLLLSASNLVDLRLHRIPPTGYISPDAMVAHIAALPRLSNFEISFQSATSRSRPDQMFPPPVTRTVLPALTHFIFKGASEYLEGVVSRIDSPNLNMLLITYLNQLVDFHIVQLSRFIDRSDGPELTHFGHAEVRFYSDLVSFNNYRQANHSPWDWSPAKINIPCEGIDWQVSHIARVLSHFPTTLAYAVHLKLRAELEGRQLKGTDDVEWLDLLRQLSTVQTLHVSRELAGHLALALEDITEEMVAEVLPSLDLIYLAGQPASSIENFVAARQRSGHPVTVIDTETEFGERLEFYAWFYVSK